MSKQTTKDILESKLSLFAPGVDVAILERTMPGVLTAIYAAMHQYASPSPGWIKASERPDMTYEALTHILKSVSLLDLSECTFEQGYDQQDMYINAVDERGIVVDSIMYDGNLFSMMNNDRESFDLLNPMIDAYEAWNDYLLFQSPAKPQGEGLHWIKASDLKEKDPNREYIGKWRRGHVNNGRFSADGSSFLFDKYDQVDYMYYDHLFILVTRAAAHSPAGEGPYFTMTNMIGFSEFANGWGWYSRGDQCWWSSHKKDGKREERSTLEMLNEYIKSLKTLTP